MVPPNWISKLITKSAVVRHLAIEIVEKHQKNVLKRAFIFYFDTSLIIGHFAILAVQSNIVIGQPLFAENPSGGLTCYEATFVGSPGPQPSFFQFVSAYGLEALGEIKRYNPGADGLHL